MIRSLSYILFAAGALFFAQAYNLHQAGTGYVAHFVVLGLLAGAASALLRKAAE